MSSDIWILLLLLMLFDNENFTNIKGENEMIKEILEKYGTKTAFEMTIKERLANPNISAEEIKTLAEAYAELSRNDWMKELATRTSGFSGFGGLADPGMYEIHPNDTPQF